MSTPTIPPRPARNQDGPTAVKQETLQKPPPVPARPLRKTDASPSREAYTRSPLNFHPTPNGHGGPHAHGAFAPPSETPRRPPSIALPSDAGQEGFEYTSYDQLPSEAHGTSDNAADASGQTRNVAAELPLHAPTASVPQSAAKNRIATVTRTDSTQAAAAGIGKSRPDDDVHKMPSDSGAPLSRVTSRTYDDHLRRVPSTEPHSLRSQSSFSRPSSSMQTGTPRPPSIHGSDFHEGIPEIGQQIPLYPNAGDVQAPSPAPTQPQFTQGIGFFNDGSGRAHHRKRSSRHEFGPPGSYGMHGHGHTVPQDQFERDWLMKHPEEAVKAGLGPYMHRPETALSTEQLNKLVQENKDIGMGTSPAAIGTPTQEIAFEATDQFASRMNSPRSSPLPLSDAKKRLSSGQQPPVESSLRNQSFPFDNTSHLQAEQSAASGDDDVIHVDPPLRRGSKVTGGGAMDNTIDLGPTGGNTEELGGWIDERGEGTPILASDETIKRPGSAFLQPAVSPEEARAADDYYYDSDHQPPSSHRGSVQPASRPSSRPNSMHGYHGGPLHRFISHEEVHSSGMGTPLEEIEEYEPLFPEGDEEKQQTKPKNAVQARPGLAHHHFPSQDVWEDTPSSLQYQTTVDTPEPPPEKIAQADGNPALVFETPEQEQRRRTENPDDMTSDNKTFAKPHFKPGVLEDLHGDRPGVQRFPSRDIWEDTPDSMRLETTVSSPQMDETRSPPEDRPTTSGLPLRQDEAEARSTTGMSQLLTPALPARPERKSKLSEEVKPEGADRPSQNVDAREREVPDLGSNQEQLVDRSKPRVPDRPKPSVPARPARTGHADQTEGAGAPLAQTSSAASAGSAGGGASSETVTSPPAPNARPAVPARPAGSKIAALQSGFMNDLNNRLKLGPQAAAPKTKEPEAEAESIAETTKEPLVDARKSRAKGPTRRKPAASPSSAAGADALGFSMSTPMTLWQIDENDELSVTVAEEDATAELEKVLSANTESNTQEPTMSVRSESMTYSPTEAKRTPAPAHGTDDTGAANDGPPPSIEPVAVQEQQDIQPELEASLAHAEAAPASAEEVAGHKEVEVASGAVQTLGGDARQGGDAVFEEPKDAHENTAIRLE
ncbi:hypothetical protein LTR36_007015 [Oleoguttula mirabilis]|uniref:Uncharacterized protein n=1 Tax=Oleoguttula mirabilis TaxID=1507867 RepID=A0AAV9JAN5_9PEZI|nr:hypothetical protein LTR36_007015 [Oleoguttula mirabilis]